MNAHKYPALDAFRLAAAFLVISNHVSPLENLSVTADYLLTRVFARFCVPFFLMTTGYFLQSDGLSPDRARFTAVMKKTAVLFGAAVLLYLPLNIYNGSFENPPLEILRDFVLNGTFYHLWYLPAVLLLLPLFYISWRKFGIRAVFAVSAVLYLVGLGGDSYYGLVSKVPFLKTFYDAVFAATDSTRFLRVPVFLALGGLLRTPKNRPGKTVCITGLAVSAALLMLEALWLRGAMFQRSDRMYLLLLPCMFFLFSLLTQPDSRCCTKPAGKLRGKTLRQTSMLLYILHPWVIVLIRGAAKLTGTTDIFIDNKLVLYLLVSAVSAAAALFLLRLQAVLLKKRPSPRGRAWIEISRAALLHNARRLQALLPPSCRLMAVLKADAYGHGAGMVAGVLMKAGVRAFAVATLAEGIALRRRGIRGEVLILGYTNPGDACSIRRFRLSQTIVDVAYARQLNEEGIRLDVHIKLDTGMHRLGIDSGDLAALEEIYACGNLNVKGLYTHLSQADSLEPAASDFTRCQIGRFTDTAGILKAKGYQVGRLHIQESYGILNYPGLPCDYARAGIALYGVLCKNDQTRLSPGLLPVLSLKARVAEVRWIKEGETVGYSRRYVAPSAMKIAAVTIGYADGIPRNSDGRAAYVLLSGCQAPVIGLICMDVLVVDVTH